MKASKLTDTIAVAGQVSPAQVAQIAEAGFKVLVNNRPDGEEAGQPASAQIEAAAVALPGLNTITCRLPRWTFPVLMRC